MQSLDRAADAAKAAVSSPLLEVSIDGARGILFTIMGGASLTVTFDKRGVVVDYALVKSWGICRPSIGP